MQVEQMIGDLIGREGGYVDHPADRGGPTRWGITQAVARAHGWAGSMRELPRDRAAAIYRAIYWERPGFADVATLAPVLAAELFDTGVNMGPAVATRFLVRALNGLNRGGRDYRDLGPTDVVTLQVIDALSGFLDTRGAAGEAVLVKAVEALQGERYLRLAEQRPANEAFVYGWIANRIGQA